jgi:hypothetical protein
MPDVLPHLLSLLRELRMTMTVASGRVWESEKYALFRYLAPLHELHHDLRHPVA